MSTVVENLVFDHNLLASRAIKLNASYFELIKIHREISLHPELWAEIKDASASPLVVISSMRNDIEILSKKFQALANLIHKAQRDLAQSGKENSKKLAEIENDGQILSKLLQEANLDSLEESFNSIVL